VAEALPVPASVIEDLRRARRKQRVAEIHWIDALYQVYLVGIVVVVVLAVISGAIGDGKLDHAGIERVRLDGPAWIGMAAALAAFVGLRSGSRGGPLAVEAADVRHVLMAPVDRAAALRGPALRQLRFATFASACTGAAAGLFASKRFTENGLAWVACGALCALTIAAIGFGAALFASSRRLPRWLATIVGGGLVIWAVADIASSSAPMAPSSTVGMIAVWPLEFRPLGIAPVVVGLLLIAAGLVWIAGLSLEAAERRTALVGQLRFAVTLQDLRTVLVLRRQLAADLPRNRPWIPALRKPGRARMPSWQRGWRGVLRWPVPRLVRLVALAVIAGFSLRAVWGGTTPMLVAAGLALWVAALDAIEPLAQETDHPGRRDSYPVVEGELMVRHLAVPVVVMLVVTGGAAAIAVWSGHNAVDPQVMGIAFVPLAVAAVLGAATSVLMGAPKAVDELLIASPEIAGTRTVLRTIFPPLVACLATLPVLMARNPPKGSTASQAASTGVIVVTVVLVLCAGWIRFAADIRAWWEEAQQAAGMQTSRRPAADEEDDE
jgi:hypothetical protein